MSIAGFYFSKRDGRKFVTDAKAAETIANIGLSRRHASNARLRVIRPSGDNEKV